VGKTQNGIYATVVTGDARTPKTKPETKRGRQEGNQRSHQEALGVEAGRSLEATMNRPHESGGEGQQPGKRSPEEREMAP